MVSLGLCDGVMVIVRDGVEEVLIVWVSEGVVVEDIVDVRLRVGVWLADRLVVTDVVCDNEGL